MTIPAIAKPRPRCPVCLIWLSARKPKTMPRMGPIMHSQPTAEHSNDAMAIRFTWVPGGGSSVI